MIWIVIIVIIYTIAATVFAHWMRERDDNSNPELPLPMNDPLRSLLSQHGFPLANDPNLKGSLAQAILDEIGPLPDKDADLIAKLITIKTGIQFRPGTHHNAPNSWETCFSGDALFNRQQALKFLNMTEEQLAKYAALYDGDS